MKMKSIVTIKGEPIIDIYESLDGSYWFVIERAWKQDSLIHGQIYKNDQIFFGYVRLSACPQFAEFGYFSEAELRRLGSWVWKVHKCDWSSCPGVEVEEVQHRAAAKTRSGWGDSIPQPAAARSCKEVAGR
jgi:hypothetical protein